jgi:hypothetical protein
MYLLHIINKKITNNIDSTIHLLTRKTQNKLKKTELLLIFLVKHFVVAVVREFLFEPLIPAQWTAFSNLNLSDFLPQILFKTKTIWYILNFCFTYP